MDDGVFMDTLDDVAELVLEFEEVDKVGCWDQFRSVNTLPSYNRLSQPTHSFSQLIQHFSLRPPPTPTKLLLKLLLYPILHPLNKILIA